MQIVFVCSEVSPWISVGGLADVMDGLPQGLARQGHRVMSIAPRYAAYSDACDAGMRVVIDTDGHQEELGVFHCHLAGVDRVFLDHPIFLDRRRSADTCYGPEYGVDWDDNQKAFSMLCNGALRVIQNIPIESSIYGEKTVIIANDWHTAFVAPYVHAERESCGAWRDAKVCMLVHNMRYQGIFPNNDNLSRLYNMPQKYINSMLLGDGGCISWLNGGTTWADQVLTVSPSYASDLDDKILKRGETFGISNGVGTEHMQFLHGVNGSFESIANHIDESSLFKKGFLKGIVQRDLGLPESSDRPLFLFIGLIDYDKGIDVILDAFEHHIFPNYKVELVVAGTGERGLIDRIQDMQRRFPDSMAFDATFRDYDRGSRNRYLAAAEWVLMPSRSDPCSLLHLEAMRFGALPIASSIGGFKDTISHLYNGILLRDLPEPVGQVTARSGEALAESIRGVLALSRQRSFVTSLQRAAMLSAESEHSWDTKAGVYSKVFWHLQNCGDDGVFEARPTSLIA